MKTMIRFTLFFILSGIIYAQKKNEEELINNYFSIYKKNTDTDLLKAHTAINKAYILSTRINNNSWLAKTAYGVGYCNYLIDKDSISEVFLNKAIYYSKKSKDEETLSKSLNVKGSIYSYKNQKKNALKYFHESLKHSIKHSFLNDNTANVLNNIADIYVTEYDTINALKYYHEAIKIQKKNRFEKSLSNTYNSLGVLYMNSNQDSALYYINQSLELAINNNLVYDLVGKHLNIAVIYLNFEDVKNYSEAKINLLKALKLANENKMIRYQFQSNLYLGIYYKKAEKEIEKSKEYLEKALLYHDKNKDLDYNLELYKTLAEVYSKSSNFKKAFYYKNLETELKDKAFNINKNRQIHEIQTKFDVERKDFQIDVLRLEKQKKEIDNFWLITVSTITIIGLIIIGLIYRLKEKKKKLLLVQENETRRMQAVVRSQDNERNRIAKDLHDGIGNKLTVFKNILHQETLSNQEVSYLRNETKDLMKEVREISHDLSLSFIQKKTMSDLIVDLLVTFQEKTFIKTELSIYPNNALDNITDEKKTHLFRIIQELLTNIDKHASATFVMLSITKSQQQLTLILEDNGCGFDIKQNKKGIGITNIQERIELIKGLITIDSTIGSGTTFIIEFNEG